MSHATARSITGSGPSAGWSRRIATTLLSRLEHGTLTVVESSGRWTFGRLGAAGIHATMHINDPVVWRTVLIRGGAGLGETYAEGAWDTDDLVNLLRLLALNLDHLTRFTSLMVSVREAAGRPARQLRPPSKADDHKNIQAHYDLGDEFFAQAAVAVFTTAYGDWVDDSATDLGVLPR